MANRPRGIPRAFVQTSGVRKCTTDIWRWKVRRAPHETSARYTDTVERRPTAHHDIDTDYARLSEIQIGGQLIVSTTGTWTSRPNGNTESLIDKAALTDRDMMPHRNVVLALFEHGRTAGSRQRLIRKNYHGQT